MLTAEQIIDLLNLKSHPKEGGYFTESYRSQETLLQKSLPDRYHGGRPFGTAIYYLLTPETFSVLHRLKSDEIFHFYLGDPVEMLQLLPDGSGRTILLGSDIFNGMQLQTVILRNIWQGARLVTGGAFALMGTTVSPGFAYEDYETGRRDELIRAYPKFQEKILSLTTS
jgi:predicted cupin superfamily sugar epimerase